MLYWGRSSALQHVVLGQVVQVVTMEKMRCLVGQLAESDVRLAEGQAKAVVSPIPPAPALARSCLPSTDWKAVGAQASKLKPNLAFGGRANPLAPPGSQQPRTKGTRSAPSVSSEVRYMGLWLPSGSAGVPSGCLSPPTHARASAHVRPAVRACVRACGGTRLARPHARHRRTL
jgi:hypothetical protein